MSREQILGELKRILTEADAKFVAVVDDVTEATDIRKDLGLTSTGMLYLLLSMEETFGPIFDDVTIGSFRTVGDLVDHIAERA